uniref:Uncharacterized protein n=1 Tax=Plectus sambesii TaxID=2011161 RepID=A0A914XI51_9BILA
MENIMKAHEAEFKREVVFLDVYEPPRDDDDTFRDEIGSNALPFLILRAKKQVTGRTVAVFTGNVLAGDFKKEFENLCEGLDEVAERKYTAHILNTQLRSTKNIASFWAKEYSFGIEIPAGHDFEVLEGTILKETMVKS